MNETEVAPVAQGCRTAAVVVAIPSGLQRFTGQVKSVEIEAETVGHALRLVADRHPLLRTQMYDGEGKMRRFINVFVNSNDIRFFQQELTPLKPGDVITILPAIAGG